MEYKNMLMSAAVGDIAGSAYEGRSHRTKDYDKVKMFSSRARFTDDTVCTFACAHSLISGEDMASTIWRCCHLHPNAGYGHRFKEWLASFDMPPYYSLGNGSAMRCSAAGWMAQSEGECIELATKTAAPTHNHPEGIKGAVAAALSIFYLSHGRDKDFIRENILNKYYPQWAGLTYEQIKPDYTFNSTCPGSVGPAIICFLESKDYIDCLKLAISLGGDADTLAAIAGPMAYAYYKEMPDHVVAQALKMLPDWMQEVSRKFDEVVNVR